MALIACKDCGERIARTALRCPKCGGWQFVKPAKWADAVGGIILVGFIWLASFEPTWGGKLGIIALGTLPAVFVYGNAFVNRKG